MAAREKVNTQTMTAELLTEETKQTLVGYHKLQMKRDQLINPAEEAIIPLLDLMEDVRNKWKYAEDRLRAAEERAERFESYNAKLNDELKVRKEKEREQAGQISMLETDKTNLEEAICDYERRITAIKKMIHQNLDDTVPYDKLFDVRPPKMPTTVRKLNPVESESAMDTNDEVKLRYNRQYRRSQSVEPAQRRSRTTNSKRVRTSRFEYIDEEESENNENDPNEPRNKRSKGGRVDEITTVTTITMDVSGRQPTRGSIEVHKVGKKRSVSASRILDDNSARRRQLNARPARLLNAPSSVDLRHKTPTGIGSSWTRGNEIEKCTHRFNSYRPVLGSCNVCNRQITFMGKALQCDYCKICIHEQCKKRAPVPCLPPASFPTPGRNADARLALRSYCPTQPPYIPGLLIRCICALEKDRLNSEGIYRVPGSKEETIRLYKDFNSKFIPNLSIEPTEVIAGCIKLFLRKLKDPLIPRSSYNEFMKQTDNEDNLADAIEELPEPNRDTLAYLCLHLQKVAMNAAQNKMTVENLAVCLSPTILGNNGDALNTLGYAGSNGNPFDEVARQRVVLERLLKMPTEFWSDYLKLRTTSNVFTTSNTTPTTHRTQRMPLTSPRKLRDHSTGSGRADCSVLGPVSSTPPQNFTPSFAAGPRRIKEPLF